LKASAAAATLFASATLAGNFSRMACATASSVISPDSAAKPPSSTALGSGRPRCLSAISVAGTVTGAPPEARGELAEAQLLEAARAVDQDVAVGLQALEHVHLVQQRRVLDDQHVGREDRLAQADRVVVDAAEGHHRRAGALGAEAREGLRVAALRRRRRTTARPR
jgi:hypothetical protein